MDVITIHLSCISDAGIFAELAIVRGSYPWKEKPRDDRPEDHSDLLDRFSGLFEEEQVEDQSDTSYSNSD